MVDIQQPRTRPKKAPSEVSSEPFDDVELGSNNDYEGALLSVTYGKEHFQPARFQGMDVGPFEIAVRIRKGETPMAAKRRAMALLAEMAEEEFREKLPRFLARVRLSESSL
jgi:hypothetical protein